jgi:hypothetical protein
VQSGEGLVYHENQTVESALAVIQGLAEQSKLQAEHNKLRAEHNKPQAVKEAG